LAAPNADVASSATLQLTVTNASGGTEVGSLRWAASQFREPQDAIITFDSALSGATITLDDQLYLAGFAAIKAPKGGITLSGKGQHRVILALLGVTLENMTVANGNASPGSAIWSGGKVGLQYSTVRDNSGAGPVIDVEGLGFSMHNSTISRNVGSAAVEYEDSSRVFISNSAIAFTAPTVVDVHSAGHIWGDCTTAVTSWSAAMVLLPGETFQPGAAQATAATFETPEWVTPATIAGAVKISNARR